MRFTIITDFNETLGKSKRSPAGEKLRKMYKAADRAHRTGKRMVKAGLYRQATQHYTRREKLMGKVYKKNYPGWPTGKLGTGSYRAASASALSDVGKLRKAAAKGRATTPKVADYRGSYTMTKLRTALRKAKGDRAQRSKLLKGGARAFLHHAKWTRKKAPTKLPG